MPSLARNAAHGAKLNYRSWYAPYLWGTGCGWAQGSSPELLKGWEGGRKKVRGNPHASPLGGLKQKTATRPKIRSRLEHKGK